MGKYNNVAKEGGRGFTLVEALTVGGIGAGGGVTIDAIANFSKLESKMSRVKWGLGGLAAVGAAYSIFGKD